MSKFLDWMASGHLRYFSKPAHERTIFREIHRARPTRIVEFGLDGGRRALKMIKFATRCSEPDRPVQYCGIDWFEAASDAESGWSLKTAHQKLKGNGAKIRLLPGDPLSVLSRQANSMIGTDLVVISANQDVDSLDRAWYYLPRMLHDTTSVFVEELDSGTDEGEEASFRRLNSAELTKLAGMNASHISRAA